MLSIGFDGAADTDGDGLLDGWEANGNDADGNGTYDVNLQSMGASLVHKDVFVEMDSMGAETVCPCHLPLAPDLDRIVAAFATSPYADNPDGGRASRSISTPVRTAARSTTSAGATSFPTTTISTRSTASSHVEGGQLLTAPRRRRSTT